MAARLWLAALLALSLAACVKPASVKTYADATAKTADSVIPIADDYVNTCQTRRSLTPSENVKNLINCDQINEVSDGLRKVSKVLSDYGKSLSQLSDGGTATYSTDLDGLAKDVSKIPAFKDDTDKINAVTGLAKVVSDWLGEAYQEREIVKALHDTNAAVVTISDALAKALANVSTEYGFEANGYDVMAWRFGKHPNSGPNYAAWVMFNDWTQTRSAALLAKKKAVDDLQGPVKKIGSTNTELLGYANNLTSDEAFSVASSFYNDASPAWQKVIDAYKKP